MHVVTHLSEKYLVKVFFMTAFEIVDVEFSNLFPSVIVDECIQKPELFATVKNVLDH